MRLDRYLAENSGLSRTDAKRAIARGEVTVNHVTAKGPAQKLATGDVVTLAGEAIRPLLPLYLMLNKPAGFECSAASAHWPSALELLPEELRTRVHFAGRLDADTTGLVLLTDDGQWSHRVSSPGRSLGKTYQVTLVDPVTEDVITQFARGIALRGDDKLTRPAALERLSDREVRLTLTEGRYHQVKRMFAAVGNHVTALHRGSVGGVMLDPALAPGQWRPLSEAEIQVLNG